MARRQQRQLEDGSTVITLVGLGVGGFVAYKAYDSFKSYLDKQKDTQQLQKDQQSTITVEKGKKLFDLNGKPIQSANLGIIASDIENALSYPKDQERAIRAFKSTPFGKVADLEKFYLEKYSKPLRQWMIDRLDDENWIKVKFYFR